MAREWHNKNSVKWSTDHGIRILRRLEADIFTEIGGVNIVDLKTRDLLAPLRKVEERGSLNLASRLRQHIHGIMRYALQIGLIDSKPSQ